MLVFSGEVSICIGSNNLWQTVYEGNLIYFPKGCVRKAYTNPNNLLHCYSIKSGFVLCNRDEKGFFMDESSNTLSLNNITSIKHLHGLTNKFIEISNEWTNKKSGYILKCRSIFMDIIYLLHKQSSYGNLGQSAIIKVEKAIDYISAHHAEDIRLKNISDYVGLSEVYLCQILKKAINFTPIEYLHFIRTNKAKDLLLSGGYTVGEVSEIVGYKDVYYFSRVFKKIIGCSPSKYK